MALLVCWHQRDGRCYLNIYIKCQLHCTPIDLGKRNCLDSNDTWRLPCNLCAPGCCDHCLVLLCPWILMGMHQSILSQLGHPQNITATKLPFLQSLQLSSPYSVLSGTLSFILGMLLCRSDTISVIFQPSPVRNVWAQLFLASAQRAAVCLWVPALEQMRVQRLKCHRTFAGGMSSQSLHRILLLRPGIIPDSHQWELEKIKWASQRHSGHRYHTECSA